MTDFYPGKTLDQEAQYLRDKVTELAQKYSGIHEETDTETYYTLLPEWDGKNTGTSPKYAQWDAVQYNGEVYRVCNPNGAEYNETPADDGETWFKVSESWPSFDDGSIYEKGAKVTYARNKYISRISDNRTTPTSQTTTAEWRYIENTRRIRIYVRGQVE